MTINTLLDILRLAIVFWLAMENLLTSMFFREIYNKQENLGVFKVKANFFLYNGLQYLIGVFVSIIILADPHSPYVQFLRGLTLLYAIPFIRSIRAYRRIFTEGEGKNYIKGR